jgi:hypothetical protein
MVDFSSKPFNRAFQQVLDDSAAAEVLRWRRCSPRTDPLVGPRDGTGTFTIPRLPIRRRLPDIPPFVITRGGEYCFAPGLRGLRWLADLTT